LPKSLSLSGSPIRLHQGRQMTLPSLRVPTLSSPVSMRFPGQTGRSFAQMTLLLSRLRCSPIGILMILRWRAC
jgi:hypothetical protein